MHGEDLQPTELPASWAGLVDGQKDEALSTLVTYKPKGWVSAASGKPAAASEPFVRLEELGRGGMGVVFRAVQTSLGREVAIKTLHGGAPEARGNFVAEARLTGRLDHPNIVPVYDIDTSAGAPVLAMKLVEGRSWADLLQDSDYDQAYHLRLLSQVCNAVAFAHSRQVVHNDLKPENVMVGAFGEVLVMDWGLAVSIGAPDGGCRHRSEIQSACGTPAYMPPELAEGWGEQLGAHTDVYLLGGMLFRILSGRPPHAGASFLEVVMRAIEGRVGPLPESTPAELRALCLKALAPQPTARHASVAAFQAELESYLQHRESLRITYEARQQLREARAVRAAAEPYEGFARALSGFEQALALWAENPQAAAGLTAARRAFARAALEQADLALAASQAGRLPSDDREGLELRRAIEAARLKQQRERRARRRLRGVLGVALGLLFLSLGGGMALLEGERVRTREQKQRAEANDAIARQALSDFTNRWRTVLRFEIGDAPAMRAYGLLYADVIDHWRRLRAVNQQSGQPSLAELEARRQIAGYLLHNEVALDSALVELQAALRVGEALRALEPGPELELHINVCRVDAGECRRILGQLDRARSDLEAALASLRGLRGAGLPSVQLERAIAHALLATALARRDTGSYQAGLEATAQCVELRRTLSAQAPDDPLPTLELIHALLVQGNVLLDLGRPRAALPCLQEGLARLDGFQQGRPTNFHSPLLRADLHENLAVVFWLSGEHPQQRAHLEEALVLREMLLAQRPEAAQHAYNLGRLLTRMAATWFELGAQTRAREAVERSIGLLTGASYLRAGREALESLAMAHRLQSLLWLASDQPAKALLSAEEALRLLDSSQGQSPPSSRRDRANSLRVRAEALQAAGRPADARADLEAARLEVLQAREELGQPIFANQVLCRVLQQLAAQASQAGERDAARQLAEEAVLRSREGWQATGQQRDGAAHGEALLLLARQQWRAGSMQLASESGAEAAGLFAALLPADSSFVDLRLGLAESLRLQGELAGMQARPQQAREFLERAWACLQGLPAGAVRALQVARVEEKLGLLAHQAGELEVALGRLQEACHLRQPWLDGAASSLALATNLRHVCDVQLSRGTAAAAESSLVQARALIEAAGGGFAVRCEAAALRVRQAGVAYLRHEEAAAEQLYLEAYATFQGLLEERPGSFAALAGAVDCLERLSSRAEQQGAIETATALLHEAAQLHAAAEVSDRAGYEGLGRRIALQQSALGWLEGTRAPEDRAGWLRFAELLIDRRRWLDASVAFKQVFAGRAERGDRDTMARAAAVANLASRQEPELAGALQEQALIWLEAYLNLLERDVYEGLAALAERPDPVLKAELERLHGDFQYMRDVSPDFDGLRELEAFQKLFEDFGPD